MTTLEAIEFLAQRSRRVARLAWAIGAAMMMAACGLVLWVQGRTLGYVGGIEAAVSIAAVVGVVASGVRVSVRALLTPLRLRWIDEIARTEGLDAKAIAASFTLDSW